MEIHFEAPERVAEAFSSLAAAFESSGFDFDTVRDSSIPLNQIWLTFPLNHHKKMLLSRAARAGEQQAAGVAARAGFPRGPIDDCASVKTGRS
jgi:hypothetical protein